MSLSCPQCGKVANPNAKFCSVCGAPLAPASQVQRLQPGQLLHNGAYRILRTLGKGGMGLVYVAENLQAFNRLCVVKEMLDYYDATDPQQVASAHQRFEDEARTLSRLTHQGIPGIQAYFSEAGHNYIVMDFVDGDNLEQMLSKQLPELQVVEYGIQVCEILEYLTSLSPPIVHHDIKPANVIVDKASKRARLVDFGTAKARLSAQSGGGVGLQKSSVYGTVGYAPPEQYNGHSEPRSDVYALAATLYHVLTNDDPGPHPFSFPQLGMLSLGLRTALAPALIDDVARRCTAVEFRRTLLGIASAQSTPPPAPPATASPSGKLKAHESYAVVSLQLPPPVAHKQVIQVLETQLGLAQVAAEILSWQAPVGYLRGADLQQAQRLYAQLAPFKTSAKIVQTSQLLSWRAGLSQSQMKDLQDSGVVPVNAFAFPQDRVCHCYACGHEWTTQAQSLSRLRNTCSKCGASWYIYRLFRCAICGHEFAHADTHSAATTVFAYCPACKATQWLPKQQVRLKATVVSTKDRLPAGASKHLQLGLGAAPSPTEVRGRLQLVASWITVTESITKGQVGLTVDTTGLQPRQNYHASGLAITNGGQARVEVEIYVEAPAQLAVNNTTLDFGVVKAQETHTLDLVIRNLGEQELSGQVSSSHPWLHLAKFSFQGDQDTIQCRVSGANLVHPGAHTATLTLDSNGGKQTVAVTVTALPTTLVVAPAGIDLGYRPHSGAAKASIALTNDGVGELTGQATTDAPWLTLDATTFKGNVSTLGLSVSLADLPPGTYNTGKVIIHSNGGMNEIPVYVGVSRYGWFIHTLRYSVSLRILLTLLVVLGVYLGWPQRSNGEFTEAGAQVATVVAAVGNRLSNQGTPTGTHPATSGALALQRPSATGQAGAGTPSVGAIPPSAATPAAISSTGLPITHAAAAVAASTATPRPKPAATSTPTATPTASATATATRLPAETATPYPTATPLPTETATLQPTATAPSAPPLVNPAPLAQAACLDPQSTILSPAPGAVVGGQIAILGTAMRDAFGYYKVEYGTGTDGLSGFSYLNGAEAEVNNGVLAEFDTTQLANGFYTLRLTVVDASGNYPPPCLLPITIQN